MGMLSFRIASVTALSLAVSLAQEQPRVCWSPDRQIELAVSTVGMRTAPSALVYSIRYQGKPVLANSKLGIDPLNQAPLGSDVRIANASLRSGEESFSLPHGKTSQVKEPYNALRVDVEERSGLQRKLSVEFRVFNGGVAFRYHVPQQYAIRELQLERELTEFRIAREGVSWPLILNGFRTSYEDNYVSLPLSAIKRESLVALPFLTEVPGAAWVAITEAHLENYAGMYLTRTGEGPTALEAKLSPRPDRPEVAVIRATPLETPWRVVQVAAAPAKLIESNMVLALNPPSKIADTSWIKPGKTSWTWWSGDMAKDVDFKPGMNTPTLKHYVDFSAEQGLEYALIDEGWSTNNARGQGDLREIRKEIDLPGLMEYARSKGVRVWLWAHWEAVDRHMDEVFAMFEKLGVAGVKIDFMERDDQWMVNFYYRAAETAAKHKLMLDFHGAYKPAGMQRTWPNVLTYEGVLGLEYLKWSNRATAEHNTVIPFTRMLAGPLDYTPGGMRNVPPAEFVPRFSEPMVPHTRAHQLALFVVFESAFTMLSDYPGAYRGAKELLFLKSVPAAWDETRGVLGEPGEYAVVARRKGKDWYIGAITDGNAREIDVPLEFLPAGDFNAQIYADAPDAAVNATHTTIESRKVNRNTALKLKLAPAGGAAIVLKP